MPVSRVVIADSDASFRRKLKDFLRHAGYTLIREAAEGKSALKIVFRIRLLAKPLQETNILPGLEIPQRYMPERNNYGNYWYLFALCNSEATKR